MSNKATNDSVTTPAPKTAAAPVRHGSEWPAIGAAADAQADVFTPGAVGLTGPGFFGRMFNLPPLQPDDQALRALAEAMAHETAPLDEEADNLLIPAGFTYLGQFIDHDLTFDQFFGPVPRDAAADMAGPRTPALDLDSVYGDGPVNSPQLYEPGGDPDAAKLRVGLTSSQPSLLVAGVCLPNDLPRDTPLPNSTNLSATIGDPRNDENLIVAQMHVAFLKFHNKIIDLLAQQDQQNPPPADQTRFERARELVRWHYQWIVLHDFLRRITMPAVLDDILLNGRRFYRFEDTEPHTPYMPVEFSVAAYRLGHSMIRQVYDYNRVFKTKPDATGAPLAAGTLEFLFHFTGSAFPGDPPNRAPIPSNWVIDWRRFFELDADVTPNPTRKIDTSTLR